MTGLVGDSRWKLVKEAAGRDGRRALYRCRCGTERVLYVSKVNTGRTRSCGCLQRELIGSRHQKPVGVAATNRLYRTYRNAAAKRGLDFALTVEEFAVLLAKNCEYCGQLPAQKVTWFRYGKRSCAEPYQDFLYTGIDRVNNGLGYVRGNVVPCCGFCNRAKAWQSPEDFINWAIRIADHQRKEVCRAG